MSQQESDPFMSKFIKPAGTWECDVCMIQNTPDATKCEACETPKPTPIMKPPPKLLTTSSTSKPDELMAKFMKSTGAWECRTCLVENLAETRKCCACETPRSGQTAATFLDVATAVSQKADPLMAKFMKPAGCWECDVCMIQNQPSSYKCEACQTPNPNAAPPPPESAGSADVLPKFGSGVITNSNFKFGGSSDSSAAVTSSEGFKFGSSSTFESAGTFKFGTISTASTETSKAFVFGQSAAAAVDEKKKSSDNSGFKFQSGGVSLATSSTPPFTFGSKINTQSSVEEKTPKESGFSQPSTLNFSFGGSEEKTAESPAPLFGTSTQLATGLGAFAAHPKPPEASSNEDKGLTSSPVIPASTAQGGFSFGSAPINTTGSASIFTVPNSMNSATSSLPSKAALPFGTQPTSLQQQQQVPKPMFGFADKADSSKNTEAVASQPFSFISTNEQPNQSTNKTPFATSVLKRQRDDESVDPLMAKFMKPAGCWECDVCMIQNQPSSYKCEACQTPNPNAALPPPGSAANVLSKFEFVITSPNFKFGSSSDSSASFTSTEVFKFGSSTSFEIVETFKFGTTSTSEKPKSTNKTLFTASSVLKRKRDDDESADPLMAKFMKPAGCWECDVCMVQNQPSSYKCEACQTPNPNAAPPPPGSAGQ